MQERWNYKVSWNYGFFFVVSFHIFLIAYNEEISLFKLENLAIFFQ